jgi:alkyldihydroxyacetonephosphate synthase
MPHSGGLDTALLDRLTTATEGRLSTSLPDREAVAHDLWPYALLRDRAGRPLTPPDAVVWPRSADEVAAVYRACADAGVAVTPFGAGTGVCGASIPTRGGVVLDVKRMDGILEWDLETGWVRAEPGILGLQLEKEANARGWSVGHYPSSLPCSTLGGFVATRSAGQLSTRYGRIDDRLAGLRAVLPDGTQVALRAQPAAGAGPDLRRVFLGSEGAFGTIVEATLRIHPLPQARVDQGFVAPSFAAGVGAVREAMLAGLRPSLLRLYDPDDTSLQAHHLGLESAALSGGALVLTSCEGRQRVAEAEAAELASICAAHGMRALGSGPVDAWYPRRYSISFQMPRYLPEPGTVIDTIEVAAPWPRLLAVWEGVRARLAQRLFTFCHLSHGYPDGACLYFSFAGGGTEEAALDLYASLWAQAMEAVIEAGGTIAHHHGAGLARAPHLLAELGEGGVEMLRRLRRALDPAGIANPGLWEPAPW